jgi:nucleoside-diphosphate-sugar epimerase
VAALFREYKPERIFHLAAYHFREGPWSAPQDVMETNIIGTVNILEAVKCLRREDERYDPVIVITGTAMCYGESLKDTDTPVKEDVPLRPVTPYALSKMAQELLAEQYFKTHGIKTIRARLFAVTGPRADHGSVYDFTRKAVMIENGILPDGLDVGDLNVYRSITDARDVAAALVLLAESPMYGEAFNLCGPNSVSILDMLEIVRSRSRTPFQLSARADFFPASDKFLVGDCNKLIHAISWKPQYSLARTIEDMLTCFRQELHDKYRSDVE